MQGQMSVEMKDLNHALAFDRSRKSKMFIVIDISRHDIDISARLLCLLITI